MLSLKIDGFEKSVCFKSLEDLETFFQFVLRLSYTKIVYFGPYGTQYFSTKSEFLQVKSKMIAELEKILLIWRNKSRETSTRMERKVKSD